MSHCSMLIFYLFPGFMEFVASQAIAEIQETDGSILNYLKKHAPADNAQGISEQALDNYIRSCGVFIFIFTVFRSSSSVVKCF